MLEKVAKILRDYKQDENLVITRDTTFAELEIDSLETVELVMNLEEEFSVNIELDKGIKTVGELVDIIEKAS